MPLSNAQIKEKAFALEAAGAPSSDIEEFVKRATQEAGITPTAAPEKKGFGARVKAFVTEDVFGGGVKKRTNLGGDIFRSTVGSRGLAGVAQMPGKVIGQFGALKESKELSESQAGLADITTRAIKTARKEQDPIKKERLMRIVRGNMQTLGMTREAQKELEQDILTPRETISTTANAALTVLTGSGSAVTSGARTGLSNLSFGTLKKLPTLLPNVEKALTVGKGVIPRAVEQGLIGGAFTASENVRTGRAVGKNVGTGAALGAVLPVAGTVASKAKASIRPAQAKASQRVVDSLIKPLLKDLSYGKNPGKRVATEGIVFNSLEEGVVIINKRKNEVGELIGETIKVSPRADKIYDGTDLIAPIDEEITKLSKNPRSNATVIQRLQDAKDDLLGVVENLDGTRTATRDIAQMTLEDIVQFKKDVGELTKFTGNASDDAAYNKALKRVYGVTKEKTTTIEPKLRELNERYADLQTAETAIKYRDKIEQRQNLIKFPAKNVAGILTGAGVVTMNPMFIAAAVVEVGLDKLLSSAAFKTRFAKWLAKASAKEKNTLIRDVPVLKNVFDRVFGKNKELTRLEIKEVLDGLSAKARPKTQFETRATNVKIIDTPRPSALNKAAVPKTRKGLEADIEKRVEKFRKESGLVADKSGKGVRQRKVTDANGNVEFVANDFSLNRAKGDMKREADSMKKYARELLYENDKGFKKLVDELDNFRESQINPDTSTEILENIFKDIDKDINDLKAYEQTKTSKARIPKNKDTKNNAG